MAEPRIGVRVGAGLRMRLTYCCWGAANDKVRVYKSVVVGCALRSKLGWNRRVGRERVSGFEINVFKSKKLTSRLSMPKQQG